MALRIERPKRCQASPNPPPKKRQNNPFVQPLREPCSVTKNWLQYAAHPWLHYADP
jgi:hypothetical protein